MLAAMQIGMLLFPHLTQLDLTGPYEVLARLPGARVELVAKTREPVVSEHGLAIVPTKTFEDVRELDLVMVPGGSGQIEAAEDEATLAWLREIAGSAKWITSACTGALLLGCAGLLQGYRAATHWAFMDLLPLVGAIPTHKRVVIDRNRITGGGVTAGIDIALTIAAEVAGREVAELIQLNLEYDPEPPFRAGHPNVARPELVAHARTVATRRHELRRAQLARLTSS